MRCAKQRISTGSWRGFGAGKALSRGTVLGIAWWLASVEDFSIVGFLGAGLGLGCGFGLAFVSTVLEV